MSEHLVPTEINLHQKSRLLAVTFSDGKKFELPCEYLRVFSPAAEVRALETPVTGKEEVRIENIEPQGQYAIRIIFDDGHDTGIYSWDTLHQLGKNHEANWRVYLQKLQDIGYQRKEPQAGPRQVKLLYFNYLAQKMRKESEELELPPNVTDVASLLTFLSRRRRGIAPLFAEDQVRVTVNKQFAERFTRLESGDEIGLVPTSPTPPPTPDLI